MPSFLKLTFLVFCFSFYQINCSDSDRVFATSRFAPGLNAAFKMSLLDFVRYQDEQEKIFKEQEKIRNQKMRIELELKKKEADRLARDKEMRNRAAIDLRSMTFDKALADAIPSDFFKKHTAANFDVSELRYIKKFAEKKFVQIRQEMDNMALKKRKRSSE